MKIRVTQENLSAALSAVSRVASGRSALPILSNILIHTEDKALYLTATNLEIAIKARVGGKVEKSGRLAIPARLLNDFVSSLPRGELMLEQTKKHALKVTAEHHESTINGADPEEFPSIPDEVPGETLSLDGAKLKEALQQTIMAASADEARQVLTGVFLHSEGVESYVVATDSYRLAEKKLDAGKVEMAHNVPASAMQEVLRNLDNNEEKVMLNLSENQAVFTLGTVVIISRLIDGKYPDYKQIIPKSAEATAEIEKEELISIVRVAGLFARESAGSVVVRVSEEDQKISVEAIASQTGENMSTAEAKVTGEGEASLNSRYLLDALQAMDSNKVEFQLSGKHSPCVIRPIGTKDYTHLVMPLKS